MRKYLESHRGRSGLRKQVTKEKERGLGAQEKGKGNLWGWGVGEEGEGKGTSLVPGGKVPTKDLKSLQMTRNQILNRKTGTHNVFSAQN